MLDHPFSFDKNTISIVELGNEPDDTAFWLMRPARERIAAIELMRQINYAYDPVADRIPRLLEVIENPWC